MMERMSSATSVKPNNATYFKAQANNITASNNDTIPYVCKDMDGNKQCCVIIVSCGIAACVQKQKVFQRLPSHKGLLGVQLAEQIVCKCC